MASALVLRREINGSSDPRERIACISARTAENSLSQYFALDTPHKFGRADARIRSSDAFCFSRAQ